MSDETKRFWERQQEANPGDQQAAIEALKRKVRSGEIPLDNLRLAAVAGDKTAENLLGISESIAELDRIKWLKEMASYGPEARTRIDLAYLREAQHQDQENNPGEVSLRESLEEYFVEPTNEHLEEVTQLGYQIFPALTSPEPDILAPGENYVLKSVFLKMIGKMIGGETGEPQLMDASKEVENEKAASGMAFGLDFDIKARKYNFDTIKEAIRSEIVPWALGQYDPIMRYVDARKQQKEEREKLTFAHPKRKPDQAVIDQALDNIRNSMLAIEAEELESMPKNNAESAQADDTIARIDASLRSIEDDPDFK